MGHFTFHRNSLIRKRLPITVDPGDQITNYDLDNLYPQRMKELSFRSPLTKQAIDIQKDFYNGEGFENTEAAATIINSNGETVADLLNMISGDFSLFTGLSKFFNFDGNGNIIEVQFLPFEYVRFGEPDDKGKHHDVKVSNNWEESTGKTARKGNNLIESFPIFNQADAQAQVLMGEGGQVLYWTGVKDMYPLASLDAVADSTQADAEIQLFELNNAAHGFHGATMLKFPGEFEDEEAERIFNQKVNDTLGSSSPGIMTVQMDYEEMDANLFESVPSDSKDDLFKTTFLHIDRRIMQNYSQPPALRGVSPEGAVFNQQDIADSFEFYNAKTKNQRQILARIFNSWGQFWHEGPLEFGEIIPQKFNSAIGVINEQRDKAGEEGRISVAQRTPEEIQSQSNLRGSVGGVQGILGIQASVNQGITSFESAVTILVEVYGFGEDVAIEILGSESQIKKGEPEGSEHENDVRETELTNIYGNKLIASAG